MEKENVVKWSALALIVTLSTTLSMPNFARAQSTDSPDDSKGMVTLAFDDGWQSQYDKALPILEEAGIKSTFYIITDTLVPGKYKSYISEEEVRNLSALGHEIGSHTVTHTNLTSTTADNAREEIEESKQTLETLLKMPVQTFAYPFGAYNEEVVQMVKDVRYENARTIRDGANARGDDHYLLAGFSPTSSTTVAEVKAFIDESVRNDTWFILALHEIDAANDRVYTSTSGFLQEIIDYIKEQKVITVTVSEGVRRLNEISDLPQNPAPESAPAQDQPGLELEYILNHIPKAEIPPKFPENNSISNYQVQPRATLDSSSNSTEPSSVETETKTSSSSNSSQGNTESSATPPAPVPPSIVESVRSAGLLLGL